MPKQTTKKHKTDLRWRCISPRSKKLRGERKVETNASTLVGVTSHVTISAKIHCK